jgi:hypothetical protein
MEKEYIDLGLSVKWANYNEGSDKPENKGGFYSYDDAMALFGDKIPTLENWRELQKNCTIKFDSKRVGFELTGPNGNSIFLPITKEKEGDFRETGAYFYSSTKTKTINHNTGMEDVWFASFTVRKDICSQKYKKINKIDCYLLGLKHQYELSIRTVQK